MANDEKKTTKAARKPEGAPSKGKRQKQKPEAEAPVAAAVEEKVSEPRLRRIYADQVIPRMMERFSYRNRMQVPRVMKVVVNMGVGEAVQNAKAIESALADLQLITGQRPNIRRARISVSNFKLRAGMPVGCAVTLRRIRMWEFLDRLLTFAMPRVRDFRGIPRRGFDGRGNFTFGLKEQLIFPEIEFDSVDQLRGMDISIVTTARTDEEAFELLSGLGMPFVRER